MGQPIGTATARPHDHDASSDADADWRLVQAAARASEQLSQRRECVSFDLSADEQLHEVPANDPGALLRWQPGVGWESLLSESHPRRALVDLYLPICSATRDRPITVGHLGQSLDGFIATHEGESHWVTGEQNILHMHRLRALCDAVVVGAGTVSADDPQLTTRLVSGPNPLRVILDPSRRLAVDHRVFADGEAETMYVCARSLTRPGERRIGCAVIFGVEERGDGIDLVELMRELHSRGCTRVFVEGGGVTVSTFLAANLLDRLQMAIAPLFIGDGRPAIRLPPPVALGDCLRPRYRVFRMGGDLLFDCDFLSREDGPDMDLSSKSGVARVI
jgi:riboflavin-specific deaminase-like protein